MAEANEGDALIADWTTRFEGLRADVQQIHVTASVVDAIDNEVLRLAQPGSSLVLDTVLRPMYADAQALRVRRLVDPTKGSNSLVRLLTHMHKRNDVLTRERYVAWYARPNDPEFSQHRGNRDFDRIAGEGADAVPKAALSKLRTGVEEAGATVKRYVDERVAHSQWGSGASITWGDLRSAIESVSGYYTKLGVILTGSSYMPEVHISHGWQEALRGMFPPSR